MHENVFPQEKKKLSLKHVEGLVWELLRIKTVFYTSLLYKLQQDPALSTALSLRHTHMHTGCFSLAAFAINPCKTTRMPFDLRAKALYDFLKRVSYYLIEKLRHTYSHAGTLLFLSSGLKGPRHHLYYLVFFTVCISPLAALIISLFASPLCSIFTAVMPAVPCSFFLPPSCCDGRYACLIPPSSSELF